MGNASIGLLLMVIALGILTTASRELSEVALAKINGICDANQGTKRITVGILTITIVCKDTAEFTFER